MINSPKTGSPRNGVDFGVHACVLPNDANPMGMVLGGHIMHLMDICGALAALRHSSGPVVTACGHHITFLHPVHIGQVLIFESSVNRLFHTSMEVGVKFGSRMPKLQKSTTRHQRIWHREFRPRARAQAHSLGKNAHARNESTLSAIK